MANYSSGEEEGKKREKQRGGSQACFSGLVAPQEFYALDIFLSFFPTTKGSFQCCQLIWSYISFIQFQFTTSLSPFSAVWSSPYFLCIHPFKYSLWRSDGVFFVALSLKEARSFPPPVPVVSQEVHVWVNICFVCWTNPFTYNYTPKRIHFRPLSNAWLLQKHTHTKLNKGIRSFETEIAWPNSKQKTRFIFWYGHLSGLIDDDDVFKF